MLLQTGDERRVPLLVLLGQQVHPAVKQPPSLGAQFVHKQRQQSDFGRPREEPEDGQLPFQQPVPQRERRRHEGDEAVPPPKGAKVKRRLCRHALR